jgi:2-keto-myo-inositol isomerase
MTILPCLNTKLFNDKETLSNKIKYASAAGYLAVELSIDEIQQFGINDTIKLINDYLIIVPSIEKIDGWWDDNGSLMKVKNTRRAVMDECKRRMEIAASLRCPFIIAHPRVIVKNKRGWLNGIDRFCELLDIGKEAGCLPTLKIIHNSPEISNIKTCFLFISDTYHADATMAIDAYEIWRGFHEIEEIPSSIISTIHISDANPLMKKYKHETKDRIMPGDGCINLPRFLNTMKKNNYTGFITVNVANPIYANEPPEKLAIESYEKIEKLIFCDAW